jgi:hypothetical protein
MDASSFALLVEGFDNSLSGHAASPVPYNIWAESYYTLRKSPKATAAVQYHTKVLQELRRRTPVFWPPPADKLVVTPERAAHNGHMVTFSVPSFIPLQKADSRMTPQIVIKAALAIMALSHTGSLCAGMVSLHGARSTFPFLPKSYTALQALEAPDVAGPTFNASIALVCLEPGETVMRYLKRMQTSELELPRYASVPWNEVFKRLGLSASEILPAASNSLLFNWFPGLAAQVFGENPHQNLRITSTPLRTSVGLLANAGVGGADGTQVVFWLNGAIANTSTEMIEQIANEWKQAVLWLSEPLNQEKPVCQLTKLLQDKSF